MLPLEITTNFIPCQLDKTSYLKPLPLDTLKKVTIFLIEFNS